MKIKMFILLLVACLFSFLIYNICFINNINYVSLGGSLASGKTPFNTINKSYSDYLASYLKDKQKLKTYNKTFTKKDYKTNELIMDIKNNKKINNIEIASTISKANLITISIGFDEYLEILNKKDYDKLNNEVTKIKDLILLIRTFNDCNIFIIGYYNPTNLKSNQEIINVSNKKLEKLTYLKKVYFVNIDKGFKEKYYYLPKTSAPYPSLEGYNYIYNQIIDYITLKRLIL
ncbi:MAG: hypothetical protein RSC57_01460 [Bacilli bacterium]